MLGELVSKDIRDLPIQAATPGSRSLHVDVNRTDAYVPDGTPNRPYVVLEDAVAVANLLATAASPVLVRVASGTYDVAPFSVGAYVKVHGAGWGMTVLRATDLANWNVEVSDATTWMPVSGFRYVALTAAAHTLTLQFAAEGGTASIRNAHLECVRWS